ncbi:MAG: 4-alpha-glucanotransferase [Anaeroplasmataceae bacterium]|nr:4-alpha-glucanotransferase [Anaeroplasmataceae bacterium]
MNRNAGVLLHITSLPSRYGIGTLGEEAFLFVDWMVKANLKIWQVLPLVPTNYGDSPYQSVSSTALNYYMIDFDILHKKGLLKKKEYESRCFYHLEQRVDYSILFSEKIAVLKVAFRKVNRHDADFLNFVQKGEYKDFAVFMTLKAMHQYQSWNLWNKEYQQYSLELEEKIIKNYNDEYLFWVWTQYEFLQEWTELHAYAKQNGIEIMGDMPLYVAYDSVEVWKHPELFVLTEDHKPKFVAGCPPDIFTADGQLWGNPIYDWAYMKKENYVWWNDRIKSAFDLYDILRIDHFRGFDKYYSIPAEHDTARYGTWEDGPKIDLFKDKLDLKIVAEDLGLIDDGVKLLMQQTNYPGMKVLEFAFDGNTNNDHKPSNYIENCVVYTGTHDNMPIYQYILDLDPYNLEVFLIDLKKECMYLGVPVKDYSYEDIALTIVELAFASKANTCIIPMQDLLCQDGTSRMNLPSTVSTKNWSYRVTKAHLSDKLASMVKDFVKRYHR